MTDNSALKVLIVEDDVDIAQMVQLSIEQNFESNVYHAKNGQLAIDYLDHTQPNIIILDLNLPVVNGWKVLEYAKKQYGEKSIKVIVTTANTDEVNRLVGKMQTVASYLQKPFTPGTVVETIHDILGNS